ncbi:hypothetical protein ACERK3_10710 [Phycisphaerales bacterium AB-hyl4]|uniref:Uncharacterized protein n=1 Tax=Natronomicrosphaera hydrolytica TaxID=3242702 RepID=A0ABV4U7E7_9BACT
MRYGAILIRPKKYRLPGADIDLLVIHIVRQPFKGNDEHMARVDLGVSGRPTVAKNQNVVRQRDLFRQKLAGKKTLRQRQLTSLFFQRQNRMHSLALLPGNLPGKTNLPGWATAERGVHS